MPGVPNIRAFAPLMRQRVTIAPRTGVDQSGVPTYSAGVTYQCAVIGDMKLVRDAHGQQIASAQQVYLMSNATVSPDDRITLSTADAGSTESYRLTPRILAVTNHPFTRGRYVTTVYM